MNEIERKFLLNVNLHVLLDHCAKYPLKWGQVVSCSTIEQHYLLDTGNWNIRIRKTSYNEERVPYYVQTMKRRITDRKCWEIEEGISKNAYHRLADFRELTSPVLVKTRYLIQYMPGFRPWEIDVFHNPQFSNQIVAELELASENEVFPIPFWIGDEVTGQKQYSNAWMASQLV